MVIEIEALDTLIFRDGKPFGGEEDSWANTNIFPSPSTIYGALRAIYFSQNPDEVSKANTKDDPTKDLKINGIYFKYRNNLIFPIPLDTVGFDERKGNRTQESIKKMSLVENSHTSSPLEYIFQTDIEDTKTYSGFLKKSSFSDYLKDAKEKFSFIKTDDILIEEPKIGIGLNKSSKSVEDGKLYRVGLNRYKDLKIVVDFEGLEIESRGLLRFGGEAKGAYYREIDKLKLPKIEKLSSNRFKVCLLTPAIFKEGWRPNITIDGVEVKLIAAAVGKPQYIGGWDIKENRPKTMYRAVPAGSVYYFEFSGEEVKKEKILERLNYKSISDLYKEEGYGIAVIGDEK